MSVRYLTLKAAYFLRITNQTFWTSFGKSIRRDLVTSYLVSFSALEEWELQTSEQQTIMVFCATCNCSNSSKSGVKEAL